MFGGVLIQVSDGDHAQRISDHPPGKGIVPESIAGLKTVPGIGKETVPEIGGCLALGIGGMPVIGADLVPQKDGEGPIPGHVPEVVETGGHGQGRGEDHVQETGKVWKDPADDGVIPERGGDKLGMSFHPTPQLSSQYSS